MNVWIRFRGTVTDEDSYHLERLAETIIKEYEYPLELERSEPRAGVRDGGLATGIAIASLTLTAVTTLFSVLSYWQSKNPKYSISLTSREDTLSITGLTFEDFQKEIDKFQTKISSSDDIEISISVNDIDFGG